MCCDIFVTPEENQLHLVLFYYGHMLGVFVRAHTNINLLKFYIFQVNSVWVDGTSFDIFVITFETINHLMCRA